MIRAPKWKHRSKHYVCFVAFCRVDEWLVAPGIRTHGFLFPISSNCKHPGSHIHLVACFQACHSCLWYPIFTSTTLKVIWSWQLLFDQIGIYTHLPFAWYLLLLPFVHAILANSSSSSRLTKKNFETRNPFSVEQCRRPRMREFSYRPIQACWVIGLLFCCFHRKQRHIHVEPVSMVDHGHMGVEI